MLSRSFVLTDLFALALLLLIFVNFLQGVRGTSAGQKLYDLLGAGNAVILLADGAQYLLIGRTGFGTVRAVAEALVCALPPLLCCLWLLFVFSQARRDRPSLLRKGAFCLPGAAVAAVALFSRLNGFFFIAQAWDAPRHGEFFRLYVAVCLLYLIVAQICIVRNRRRLSRRFSSSFSLCALPPLIGAAAHPFFLGPSPAWPCLTFSLLVLFLNFQRGQLSTDHLTGLYNRWHLDYFLRERMSSKKRNIRLAGIMADLDFFKHINDRYGHMAGDRVLVDTGNILRASVRGGDFVCRYGGDEFIVLVDVRNRAELERIVRRIHANVARYNLEDRMPFRISVSLGYDLFDPESGMTPKQFLRHIDQLMYKNKNSRKERRRGFTQVPGDPDRGRQAPP
mgnify:CR=1 FL=1